MTRLNLAGWAHLIVFGLWLPAVVVWNARKIAARTKRMPPRLAHFHAASLELLVLAMGSLAVARSERLPLFSFGVPHPGLGLMTGLVMYVGAVLFMRPRWRRAVLNRARSVHYFMHENGMERAWWFLVSVLAGVGEEITWRGVQTTLLVLLTGRYWIAAALSAASFGAAHALQGWRAAAIIVFFGLGFQVIVFASGSLYVAMAVHVAYDVTAGLAYGKLGRELGYAPDL